VEYYSFILRRELAEIAKICEHKNLDVYRYDINKEWSTPKVELNRI